MIRAVLGGSFDPVHSGHVAMARHVLGAWFADQVVIIPNWQSPHKDRPSAPPEHRLAMVRLAFDDIDEVTVDDGELRAGRAVTTIETMRRLTAAHPADGWRLIIGADNVPDFVRWRDPEAIQDLATVVVLSREGRVPTAADLVAGGLNPDGTLVDGTFDVPVSSHRVRAMLAGGEVPQRLLPPAVAAYIVSHGLYQPV